MLQLAETLRKKGFILGILSDQTDWLDEMDQHYHFFRYFDRVFNSYHLGNSKRNPEFFVETCASLLVQPQEVVFIDDNPGHIERASAKGLRVIHFKSVEQVKADLQKFIDIGLT